jgi:cAMP phosphodiesterase
MIKKLLLQVLKDQNLASYTVSISTENPNKIVFGFKIGKKRYSSYIMVTDKTKPSDMVRSLTHFRDTFLGR